MKNILTTLFVIVLSILSFSFTTDTNVEDTYKPIQELSSDARFIALLQDQTQLMSKVKDLKTLKSYDSKQKLSNTDINKISNLLGYRSKAGYERSIVKQNAVIKALDKDYNLSKYSESQLTQLGITAMNSSSFRVAIPIVDGGPIGTTNECEDLCESSRRSCIYAVGAAAVAAHIACGLADITIAGGIACHAAVLAVQATQTHQCNTTYNQCIHGCRN